MASCAACDTTIFLGKKVGPHQYCNGTCAARGPIAATVKTVPLAEAEIEAHVLYSSPCPRCRRAGPIDVHTSHFVWSAIFVTSWQSTPNLCCKRCGLQAQAIGAVGSFFLGWWGFPAGLVVTPVMVIGNVIGMLSRIGAKGPSRELRNRARLLLAQRLLDGRRLEPHFSAPPALRAPVES